MKRGQPLQRRTPLQATGGLRRTPMRRTTPMRQRPADRPHTAQDGPTAPGWSEDTRQTVSSRSGGRCELYVWCLSPATDLHHRQRRREGRHDAANGLHLCRQHHRYVHANPAASRACGWIVSAWADPSSVPVLRRGVLVLLEESGGWRPAVAP